MSLASLDDVNNVLRYVTGADAARDAQLRSALMAVESRMEGKLRHIGKEGNWVETFFDVYEDATLWLPSADATVTLVKVFTHSGSGESLSSLSSIDLGVGHGYDVTDDGRVILRPTLSVSPFPGAVGTRLLQTYSRVEVHYQGTGQIPKAVTEGIALLAAGYWKDAPRTLNSLKSEKIGDYSYTVADSPDWDESDYVKRAMWFLGPYLSRGKRKVMVT